MHEATMFYKQFKQHVTRAKKLAAKDRIANQIPLERIIELDGDKVLIVERGP